MKNIATVTLRALRRIWPVVAGIGVFALAQLVAYAVPHRCSF